MERRAFEVKVCLSVAMSGGTGEEQCGAQRRAFEVQVCLSVAVFARFLCKRRAKVAGNFVTFIKFRQNDERKRKSLMKNIGKGSTGGPFQKQEKWANKAAVQRNQRAEGRAPRS